MLFKLVVFLLAFQGFGTFMNQRSFWLSLNIYIYIAFTIINYTYAHKMVKFLLGQNNFIRQKNNLHISTGKHKYQDAEYRFTSKRINVC